jgi:hypothetical protein
MSQHIFSFESELQNNQAEVAPSSPNFSLSVSEKLSRYGVNALSDVEHLGLLVGKETLAFRRAITRTVRRRSVLLNVGMMFPHITRTNGNQIIKALIVSRPVGVVVVGANGRTYH